MKTRRVLSALLTSVFLFSFVSVTAAADTPSSWAAEQVNAAVEAKLVPAALQFDYARAATRADFCALSVALYENLKGVITERKTFTDTKDVSVEKAAAVGVVLGVGDNKFDPGGQLTREQAAVMLSRLADVIGNPFPKRSPSFADNGSISSWAVEHVGRAQASGIMVGVGENKFAPKQPYTREQSIVTILRAFDLIRERSVITERNVITDTLDWKQFVGGLVDTSDMTPTNGVWGDYHNVVVDGYYYGFNGWAVEESDYKDMLTARAKVYSEWITSGMDDVDKVIAVCKWMSANVVYTRPGTVNGTEKYTYQSQRGWAALVASAAACAGYADAVCFLLDGLGIECVYIVGSAGGSHAWNLVKLEGSYYHLDTIGGSSNAFMRLGAYRFSRAESGLGEDVLWPKRTLSEGLSEDDAERIAALPWRYDYYARFYAWVVLLGDDEMGVSRKWDRDRYPAASLDSYPAPRVYTSVAPVLVNSPEQYFPVNVLRDTNISPYSRLDGGGLRYDAGTAYYLRVPGSDCVMVPCGDSGEFELDHWEIVSGDIKLTDLRLSKVEGVRITEFVMPKTDVRLRAHYRLKGNVVDISIDDSTQGVISANTQFGFVDNVVGMSKTVVPHSLPGDVVTLTASGVPVGFSGGYAEESVFDYWEVLSGNVTLSDIHSVKVTFTMPDSPVKIKAHFKAGHQVIVEPNSVALGTAYADCGASRQGDTVSLIASASYFGVFSHWSVVSGNTVISNIYSPNTSFTMPDADVKITAHFKDKSSENTPPAGQATATPEGSTTMPGVYPVSVSVIDFSCGEARSSKATAAKGETVRLSASAYFGYDFDYWEVLSGNVNIYTVDSLVVDIIMPDAAVSVKAHFKQKVTADYKLTVRVNNNAYGSAESSTAVSLYGIEATLVAIPNEGYEFSHWEVLSPNNFASVSWAYSPTPVFRMPEADVVVMAVFQPT
jgi:hypothetical protein